MYPDAQLLVVFESNYAETFFGYIFIGNLDAYIPGLYYVLNVTPPTVFGCSILRFADLRVNV